MPYNAIVGCWWGLKRDTKKGEQNMSKKPPYVRAIANPGSWILEKNPIWNIPADTNEIRFNIETIGPWSIPLRVKALAVTLDGKVFGERTMYAPKESGYQLEGRVSIGGKKYRAWTSSQLFERPDKSLCEVAVLYVSGYPNDDNQPKREGYTYCKCRDCFEITIGKYGNTFCSECIDAGCPDYQGVEGMSQECQRPDAYGMDSVDKQGNF
jgi:hypothetical protein